MKCMKCWSKSLRNTSRFSNLIPFIMEEMRFVLIKLLVEKVFYLHSEPDSLSFTEKFKNCSITRCKFQISVSRDVFTKFPKSNLLSCSCHQFTNSPIHDYLWIKIFIYLLFFLEIIQTFLNLEGASKCIS